ncbi:alpha/beta hydrolase fold domain-containing protein [Mycolicibacterium sp. Dal123E01]|uniref:alpha/beta hydrolase fold domain-containing protein n=1 Tax=Mycolicibacterium sp. Dal123E01 TaxID=3457578 RepID=UPI00403E6A7B
MDDRMLRWAGAGVLATGLSTSVLFGAAVAAASPDSTADGGSAKTAQSTGGADTGVTKATTKATTKKATRPPKTADAKQDSQTSTDPDADKPSAHSRKSDRSAEYRQARTDHTPASSSTDADDVGATAEPTKRGAIDTIVGAVSSVVSDLLNPFAAGGKTPEVPGAQPQIWTLAAASRREFDRAFQTPVAGLQAPAVENSLTYLPPPTIIDRLTVASLRLVRDVTGLFGIPWVAVFSQLITSANPPFFLTPGLNAHKTDFEVSPGDVWKVWEFEPPNPTGATVIAIHGGGAIFQPNILHWIDYTQMARETGATVLVPLYPLATSEAGSLLNVTPGMADYISQVIDDHGAQNVSIYGDSEGATYAFAAVRDLILAGKDVPASMVLVSGQADYSTENTGEGVDDPFFNTVTVNYFARFHTFDGIVDKDPRISPLRMETEVLQALPPTTMYVGTNEILWPANLMLYQRAVDIGAPISLVVAPGQFHDWPLAGLPTNSAAPLVRRNIYLQLGLLPAPSVPSANTSGPVKNRA